MNRVALFVDGANMFYAQRDNHWHIDYKLTYQFFLHNREKSGAYYFTASPAIGDSQKIINYRRFKTALIAFGYTVIDKEVKVIRDTSSGITRVKGNLDIELVFRMLASMQTYDRAILMGGDSDYIPIIDHLKNSGKIVEVVGRRESVSMELINAANEFTDLNSIRSKIERHRN